MNRAFWKYALLQLPGYALVALALYLIRKWVDLPLWLAVLLIALWIAKDVAFYPVVRRAYGPDEGGVSGMIGRRGRVKERLDPVGSVELNGELWRAEIPESAAPIEKGGLVEVREVKGLTLLVAPAEDQV